MTNKFNPDSNYFNLSLALSELQNSSIAGLGTVADDVNTFLVRGQESNYKIMVKVLNNGVNEQIQIHPNFRALLTLADGTVAYDSGKAEFDKCGFITGPGKNTWENEQSKSINENHNTRPEILLALLNGSGESERLSTTIGADEHYEAKRLGNSVNHALGVLRANIPDYI